jgi:DNA-binding winged helix-turn-helix (wHTH) protein
VRRLRAKLGPEYEALIGTVRNVGYRFVAQQIAQEVPEDESDAGDGAASLRVADARVPADARTLTRDPAAD